MGQGNYYAIIYGVKNCNLTEEQHDKINKYDLDGVYNPDTGRNRHIEVRVTSFYESKDHWCGIVISIDDETLSRWWSAGYFDEIEIDDKWIEKTISESIDAQKKLELSKRIWKKIEPFLIEKGCIKKEDVGLHLIKDWD